MKHLICYLCALSFLSCRHDESRYLPSPDKDQSSQVYFINSARDTTIFCDQGTILKLKSNSFLTPDAQEVRGQLKLQVREFYTIQHFINNRLSTKTVDGKLLTSSGMVLISALAGNENLKLKEDRPLTIMFRKIQYARTANLFSGETGPFDETRWSLLKPVHNDTTVIKTVTVKPLSYGEEMVSVELKFVIGQDTIRRNSTDSQAFENFLERLSIDRTYDPDGIDQDKYYIFKTTSLGFLNCDIFLPDQTYDFTVKLDNSKSDVFIVLDSLNSLLYPDLINENTNEYSFSIPRDKRVSVVAYRRNSDKHYFGLERTKSGEQSLSLGQVETDLDVIRQEINRITVKNR